MEETLFENGSGDGAPEAAPTRLLREMSQKAFESADHLSVLRTSPAVSPGSSMPVRSPKPKRRM